MLALIVNQHCASQKSERGFTVMPILFNYFKGDNQPNIEFSKTSGVAKTQHLKIAIQKAIICTIHFIYTMKNDESKL